ncbi:hypothetical protein AB0E01_12885 [Nocardia vinacea]|uniref:hypothetical protein n=1 Tax=Nocardia vinacea TaxID=96468 RepID=UPI0033D05C8A
MAGMRITVCLPALDVARVEAAVAEAMAPFEIDYTRDEDRDIWDSWRITGRLPVLPDQERDPRLIQESSRIYDTRHGWVEWPRMAPDEFGWCAGGPRELLDLWTAQKYQDQARQVAEGAWQRWRELAAELPTVQPRQFYQDRHDADPGTYSSEQADADYAAQPLVHAYENYLRTSPSPRAWSMYTYDPVVAVGSVDRDEFVAFVVERARPRHNVLSLDGWWYEDGWTGIHGACRSTADCPHEPEIAPGYDHLADYLAALPGDTMLVELRCHV